MSQIHSLSPVPATPESDAGNAPAPAAGADAGHPSDPSLERRISSHLHALAELAAALEGEPEALLTLLRQLEQLHRTIQDGPFRASLPEDRNALFRLLSEMESSGGWPYIPRLQLRTFLDLLQREEPEADPQDAPHNDSALAA